MKMRFSILFVFIVCIISIMASVACNHTGADTNIGNDERNKSGIEDSCIQESSSVKNTEIALEETKPVPKMDALENFGRYLEKLITEGRKTELDSQIISTRLNIEEAALLAEKSPLLEHIRYYAEDQLTIVTGAICILTADINGDGINDVIEYGPDENGYSANMLNIYLGTEDGGAVLSYSQLLFDTWAAWTDTIEVVRYEEETYLLFMGSIDHNLRSLGINAYRISDGVPRDKLKLDYICSGVNVVITDNKDAYDTRFIEENSISLYHRAYPFHCDISCERVDYGSGETKGENSDELYDKYVEKYTAEQKPYVEKYAEKIYWYNISNISDSYESDINNDGMIEKYVKEVKDLWLPEVGFSTIGYSLGLPFMTGEYYGIHEGRRGLMYYIESAGEETDFFKMCGLDIWERELTPQYFWVEQTEKGNITYITFQDENEHKQYIDGYFIQGDSYERVISAEYIPSIECSIDYEVIEESDNVGYIVHLSKDRKSLEFEWNDSNGQDKCLNQTIRKLIEKEIEATDFEGGEFEAVQYYPKEASKEKLIVDYMIFYYVPWADTMIEEHSDFFRISIDLLTGECIKIDEVEFEKIIQQILEGNQDSIDIFFEKYPKGLRWIQLSCFDFTKDGCKEIILSKEYVETSAVVSHNYVYDCYGNKLLEFVSGDITSMEIFYDEDNSLYYLENKLHISAHQDMALYEEIAVSENLEITISFIEWDTRDGRARADNQEDGYFVFDSFTRYEEQAIWEQDMDGILEILNKKEAKGTNEKIKQYVSKLEQLKKSKVEPYGSMYDWEIGMELAE